jgi:hypothetical protein
MSGSSLGRSLAALVTLVASLEGLQSDGQRGVDPLRTDVRDEPDPLQLLSQVLLHTSQRKFDAARGELIVQAPERIG